MILLVAATALALSGPDEGPVHNHDPQLGTLSFETSCSEPSDALVERGLRWLHSFEYPEAARAFSKAAEADPACGIAYWGVAMSYYHPLWVPPTPAELDKAEAALAAARTAGARSERERAYLAAIETFYRDARTVSHKERALAYSMAMERLHREYPQDREAAVFYALSLIAAGTMDDDPSFSKEKSAGVILNQVLAQEPDHPGVAHYLIHNFDYPALADLALPAARRYAGIAPASPHAQHMPSHIFVRLGLWDEAIASNIASERSARAYAKAAGLADSDKERLHAMDYLAYAYLQLGQDSKAEQVLADLNKIQQVDPPAFSVAYAATAIPARLVLERRQWAQAASLELNDNVRRLAPLDTFSWAQAHIHFARAIGAARSGNVPLARDEVAKLKTIEEAIVVPPGTYDWRTQVAIQRRVAEAWLAFVEGRKDESLQLMRAAAELDDATEKHPVTPGSLLPAREQLGELLLELGRPADALVAFEASLQRAPKRLASLYGAARSAKLAGNADKAGLYYSQLAEQTSGSDGSRMEVKEARAFATQTAQR
ncbi:MAG TPA: hypothetical protein VFO51_02505 [Sphingomicrobium sp.]|nr:hypothetical protein [Sphingomicrobium sp.]